MVNDNFTLSKRLTHLDYNTINYKNIANANSLTYMSRKSCILSRYEIRKKVGN